LALSHRLRAAQLRRSGNWSLRALVVLPLSLVMFGLLMEYAARAG
jgi:uncharacterized membrane protein